MVAPVILVEASPRRAADGVAVPVRLAGGGADRPYFYGGQHWRAGLAGLPRSIASLDFDGQQLGGGGVAQALELRWSPGDPDAVAALAALFWQDAAVTVRVGPEGEATPPVIAAGLALRHAVDGDLRIALADGAADLKRPLLVDRFAGTGGIEGPAEWAGLIKGRAWGRCFNVPGAVIDAGANVLCFGDPRRPWQAFVQLRDRGAAAAPATLTVLGWQGSAEATFAALRAAATIDGGGVLAPSIACVKWWTAPGALHADVLGENAGGYVETAPEIAARIVAARSALAFAPGAVAAAAAARPAPCGWRVDGETATAAGELSELLAGVSLSWVLADAGIDFRRWEWTASTRVARSEGVTRRDVFAPVATRKLGYRRNQAPMARGDLAAIVLARDVVYDDGSLLVDAIANAAAAAAQAGARADASLAQIAVIQSDGWLSAGEKPAIIRQFNDNQAELPPIYAQARALGLPEGGATEIAAWTAAYQALNGYLAGLTPALGATTLDTAIVPATFNGRFADYYYARQLLLNAMAARAATTATWANTTGPGRPSDNADVTGANTAADTQRVAGTLAGDVLQAIAAAGTAATGARGVADAAKAFADDVAADNRFSIDEKKRYIALVDGWSTSVPALITQGNALDLGGPASALLTAYTAFTGYLGSIGYSNLTYASAIVRATFLAKQRAFGDALTALSNALDAKAATLATWAGTSGAGKPADYATRNDSGTNDIPAPTDPGAWVYYFGAIRENGGSRQRAQLFTPGATVCFGPAVSCSGGETRFFRYVLYADAGGAETCNAGYTWWDADNQSHTVSLADRSARTLSQANVQDYVVEGSFTLPLAAVLIQFYVERPAAGIVASFFVNKPYLGRAQAGADVTTAQPIVSRLNPVTGRAATSALLSTNLLFGLPNAVSALATAADQGGGSGVTISIPNHLRAFAGEGGLVTVSYTGGSLTNRDYQTTYLVYCDDPALTGGAVTYQATIDPSELLQSTARYHVTTITTPAAGGSGSTGSGGSGSTNPGSYPGGGGGGGIQPPYAIP